MFPRNGTWVVSHQENALYVVGMQMFPPSGCEIQSVRKRGYAASKCGSCCVSWPWFFSKAWSMETFDESCNPSPYNITLETFNVRSCSIYSFWSSFRKVCNIGPRSVRAGGTNILRQGNKLDRTVLLPESCRTGARLTKREKIQWKWKLGKWALYGS